MTTAANGDVVLLGAGASYKAGLPISAGLTNVIADEIQGRRNKQEWFALNLVVAAMQSHRALRGIPVRDGIDVESVFAAVGALAHRDTAELAPFVANWIGGLDAFGPHRASVPAFFGRDLANALRPQGSRPAINTHQLEQVFTKGVNELTQDPDDSKRVYTNLQSSMVQELEAALKVKSAESFDYLRPLFQMATKSKPRIATLNYDLGVETAAQRQGLSLDTGRSLWHGGYRWGWRTSADVQLLKMHGSVGWRTVSDWDHEEKDTGERIIELEDAVTDQQKQQFSYAPPTLVFGHGAKLRADGPFLAMLFELSRWLDAAQRLVVVGYSFGDDHINAVIQQWMVRRPKSIIVVVNPAVESWQNTPNAQEERSEFANALARAAWVDTHNPERSPSRYLLIPSKAEDALPEIFGEATATNWSAE